MTKQNLWLIINALIIMLVAFVLVLVNENFVPKEPKDLLFGQMVELSEAEIINQEPTIGHYAILHSVQTATNRKGEVVGVVYRVIARNSYKLDTDAEFGYIDLLVGIDLNQKIWIQPNKIDQTATYVGGIQDHIFLSYQGLEFSGLIGVDLEAGTTAKVSTGLIKNMVGQVISYHVTQSGLVSEVNVG